MPNDGLYFLVNVSVADSRGGHLTRSYRVHAEDAFAASGAAEDQAYLDYLNVVEAHTVWVKEA